MRIDFDEEVTAPPEVAFDFLRSPTEWPRLYGLAGVVRDLGRGWYAIPLAGDQPDLEARLTRLEIDRLVAWELRGTFAGTGEVNLTPSGQGTRITGFEEIDVAGLNDPEVLAVVIQGFESIWQMGWDRLRSTEHAGD